MRLPTFSRFTELTENETFRQFHAELRAKTEARLNDRPHGRDAEWQTLLDGLPPPSATPFTIQSGVVTLRASDPIATQPLTDALLALKPWRKGPFNCLGIEIDSEWRSDWKWARIEDQIEPLAGRAVLDIGCGNGYYLYRMLGAGARLALGVDPTRLFCYQFQALQQLQPPNAAAMLPLTDEDLPSCAFFDTVFSMGVLYHRRDPIQHLRICHDCLAPGGELVLETLILAGASTQADVLTPPARYAQMRNVWEIPSLNRLKAQLEQAGFTAVRVIDVTQTTVREQRSTQWMEFQSLKDFLDPNDLRLTIEGYPAPTRALVSAKRSSAAR